MAEVVVVGGGPAGMAAAVEAAAAGSRVTLVDDNAAAGGQIWRGESRGQWFDRLRVARVEWISGTRVVAGLSAGRLLAESADGAREIAYERLIVATGARERFLPFPGWTLPNVMGVGGLQAMVKGGLPVAGKRVVVAGSGPLLLAVASALKKHGASILFVAEQAGRAAVAAFARSLWRHPAKLARGAALRLGVAYATDAWVVSAEGTGRVEQVTLSVRGRTRVYEVDYLACGFGLVPNTELAAVLGCRVDEGGVIVDTLQRTTVAGVYCAGEPTGVGGVELAVVEGRIAGLAAAGREAEARRLTAERDRGNRFRRSMELAFRLRPELNAVARPDTIVCRCEDVRLAQLQPHRTWRAMKLQTRCGMGPCQGRVCGPAVEQLLGCAVEGVREPILPVRVGTLVGGWR